MDYAGPDFGWGGAVMRGHQIAQDILNGLSEVGRAAVVYAGRGILVFPCRERTTYGPDLDKTGKPQEHKEKSPYTTHGCHDATTDLGQVVRWWKQHPNAAIGLRTGTESGIFVVDVDTKNGTPGLESWASLQAQHGPAPRTRQARTASGGLHVYLKHPRQGKTIKTDAGRIGPGLDLRGDGNGYIIAPPSVIESGAYTWDEDLPTVEAPEWLLELAVKKPRPEQAKPCQPIIATMSTPYGETALKDECENLASTPAGQRHDQLFRSVAALGGLIAGGEVVEAQARAAIMLAVESWNTGAESEAKTLDTIEDALTKGMSEPRNSNSISLQMFESVSGMSGMSGEDTDDKGSALPNKEKSVSGMSGTTAPLRLPDGFEMNAKGIWYVTPSDDGGEPEKIWLGPLLHFMAKTRNSDSEAWGILLAWHDPDGKPHRWAMPYSMLNDTRQGWRAELASGGWIGATGNKPKALLGQLLAAVSVPARARCVDRTGWHSQQYVLPDEIIGKGAERLVLQTSMASNPFAQAGTLDGWQQTIGAWARGNRLLMFGISAALSGFLLDPTGMDSGGFHFWGHSSTGKTTIMRAAWSVCGGPAGVRTWRSTANALEAISSLHNDACLCLDEIGQAGPRVVGEGAYLLSNGMGKSRAHMDGSARGIRAWRCVIQSNGEMTLADKMREDGQQIRAGQEVRIIDLSADAGQGMGAWQELHGHETPGQFSDAIRTACAANYGALGRAFIHAMIENWNTLAIPQKVAQVLTTWTPPSASGQARRVIQRFALAAVAGELAVGFDLVPWTEGESLTAAKECLDSWLVNRDGAGDQEDRRAVETVRAFISRYGSSRFQTLDLEGMIERIPDRAGFKRFGSNKQWEYIFTTDQWKLLMSGLNPKSAAQALSRSGMIRPGDGRSLTAKIAIPDLGRPRCYVVVLPDMPDNENSLSGTHKHTAGKASPDMPDMPDRKTANVLCDPKSEGWWSDATIHAVDQCDGHLFDECPHCRYSMNDTCTAITAPF